MATYVLVHGAWSGAFTWRFVRPLLQGAGHVVYTPTLTGLGDRVHLASAQVDLSTHALDVANTMAYEDLRDVVLVGYSYGGMAVTAALRHVAERVRHLVYIDAFVPRDGESLFGITGQRAGHGGLLGSEWLAPFPVGLFGDEDRDPWFEERRSPHPIGCFEEPAGLERALEDELFTRTYIKATVDAGPGGTGFWAMAQRYREHPAWGYREIEADHHLVRTHPKDVADVLLDVGAA